MRIEAVGRPDVTPFTMPDRFRTEISYFMTPQDAPDVPSLGENEYWIRRSDAETWLNDLVISVVSPLSADVKAEIELTEEQEAWLEWLVANNIEHVRLVADG